ncbi:MAG: triose-phosphate isomerase, partial [Pirellulales bacterium]|nr:triose-phosphate isomerase [Pirellulales bacterium]
MRRPFIAGNWKMNLDRQTSVALASELSRRLGDWADHKQVDVAVCPPSCYIDVVVSAVDRNLLGVGAQNLYHQ